jgi:hypothetical protein
LNQYGAKSKGLRRKEEVFLRDYIGRESAK